MIIAINEGSSYPTGIQLTAIFYRSDTDEVKIYSVPTVTSLPSGANGKIVWHSTEKKLYVYYSTAWHDVTALNVDWQTAIQGNVVPDSRRSDESLTRLQYAGRDFKTVYDEVMARLKGKYASDYEDFAESDMGLIIVDLFSFVADNLALYQDRNMTDSFIETAVLKKSVHRIARLLGYAIGKAQASGTLATLTLGQAYSFPVQVPEGFLFKTNKNILFELDNTVTFNTGETTLTAGEAAKATVTQGQTFTMNFVSSGSENQKFSLTGVESGKSIAQDSVIVNVDGELWTEVSEWNCTPAKEYKIFYGDEPPTLVFGDGVTAQIPTDSTNIEASFRSCDGKAGKITSGAITELNEPLVVYGIQIDLLVTNASATLTGRDEESLNEIRTNAPKAFRTGNRAVSVSDIETLAYAFSTPSEGAVTKCKALVVRRLSDDVYLSSLVDQVASSTLKEDLEDYLDGLISGGKEANIVKLYTLVTDTDGDYVSPTAAFLLLLEANLATKSVATMVVQALPGGAFLRKANVITQIKVVSSSTPATVIQNAAAAIETLLQNKDFGDALRLSDIYSAVESVTGVSYSHTVISLGSGTQAGAAITAAGDMEVESNLIIIKGVVNVSEMTRAAGEARGYFEE